ncbi:hypothetical protein [Olegusella massiliensis]|uniref:hypothetical protein n=1 Tax=Olegusella massiliensis TaxID=1776381 RepID=UPI0009EE8FF2|nr:hypothetical protein [Olegusella massiliensis]
MYTATIDISQATCFLYKHNPAVDGIDWRPEKYVGMFQGGFGRKDPPQLGDEVLFNAIYYNREDLLERYRSRYADVRFLFTPDYSQFGDVSDLEEYYRLLKARIVDI